MIVVVCRPRIQGPLYRNVLNILSFKIVLEVPSEVTRGFPSPPTINWHPKGLIDPKVLSTLKGLKYLRDKYTLEDRDP